MSEIDEDYWTNSKPCHYNFDEEDEESGSSFLSPAKETESIFNSHVEESNTLPIHMIISKRSLSLILDDINTLSKNVIPPAEETLRRMRDGQKFVLCMYRSLKDKLLLLEHALKTWDGYIILCVINYLKQTLKPQLFYFHLTNKKVAIRQYAYYLKVNNRLQELEDLYMATGNISSMDELYYLSCKDMTNKQHVLKMLDQTSQKINNPRKRSEISQYTKLLEWQLINHKDASSVIDQLSNLVTDQLTRNPARLEEEVTSFKKAFNISDYQFEWTLVNAICSLAVWPKLVNMFVKANWFTKKSSLKTVLNHSTFVMIVHKYKPPRHVIEELLQCMSDQKKAFSLAEKLSCHKYLINQYIANKDRIALISYKNNVPSQSEEFFLIENALQASDKRWKN